MSNSFLVNEDGTINLHYSSLSPRDVAELISKLESNLKYLKSLNLDPIDVLNKSAKLNRITQEITFQLNWNSPVLSVNINNGLIPEPNVDLNGVQKEKYYDVIQKMLERV